MPNISIDPVTKGKLEKIREETGASTNGEVIRNAVKSYLKEIAAEKKAESSS